MYIYIWMFPKIVVPPKSSILIGKPSIMGYHYFWKHPSIYIYMDNNEKNMFFFAVYNVFLGGLLYIRDSIADIRDVSMV